MSRKIENIILILVVAGMVVATSLSGWMNKKIQAAPSPPAPAQPTVENPPPKANGPTNNYYFYGPQPQYNQRAKIIPI